MGAHMIANSIKPNGTQMFVDTSTPLMNPVTAGDTKCGGSSFV